LIQFPAIWWIFPAALVLLILFSIYLTLSGGFESGRLRYGFILCGACLGFLALALPLFQQTFYQNPVLNYAVGLPLTLVGLVGRIYPMIYLRRQCTTTATIKSKDWSLQVHIVGSGTRSTHLVLSLWWGGICYGEQFTACTRSP
jgi:hypothetical protein